MTAPSIVWFRQDLRVTDNPALAEAARRGPVIPVFVWSPGEEGVWAPGGASRWWLHRSLASLAEGLAALGAPLVIRQGPAGPAIRQLVRETGAGAVLWNRRYEPGSIARDRDLKTSLRAEGCEVVSGNGSLLWEPWTVHTRSGGPFQVFTPFYKHCLEREAEIGDPQPAPERLETVRGVASLQAAELGLDPVLPWAKGFTPVWTPGETGAAERLREMTAGRAESYPERRDQPGIEGTSRLSPHLHFGEIGPRQIWRALAGRSGTGPYLRQIAWREFAHHLLFHFPQTPQAPLRAEFARFPWRRDEDQLQRWQRGQTGYPMVDAGMRELWTTGWMHNRVRMIAASFLVKDLRISWEEGAFWFWDTLVDANLANNTLGWQWTAGCGADAAPYFRVFNPVMQGERFDPAGSYVRRWVPELAGLPDKWIHRPWECPEETLNRAGVRLGIDYPRPLVDHAEARDAALEAFGQLREEASAESARTTRSGR